MVRDSHVTCRKTCYFLISTKYCVLWPIFDLRWLNREWVTAYQRFLVFLAPRTFTECVEWLFTDWCSSHSIDRTSGATLVVVVLNTLMAPPFEPLVKESLCVLSLKALLLFALTSVKRIGHLQALLGRDSCLEIGPALSSLLPLWSWAKRRNHTCSVLWGRCTNTGTSQFKLTELLLEAAQKVWPSSSRDIFTGLLMPFCLLTIYNVSNIVTMQVDHCKSLLTLTMHLTCGHSGKRGIIGSL